MCNPTYLTLPTYLTPTLTYPNPNLVVNKVIQELEGQVRKQLEQIQSKSHSKCNNNNYSVTSSNYKTTKHQAIGIDYNFQTN